MSLTLGAVSLFLTLSAPMPSTSQAYAQTSKVEALTTQIIGEMIKIDGMMPVRIALVHPEKVGPEIGALPRQLNKLGSEIEMEAKATAESILRSTTTEAKSDLFGEFLKSTIKRMRQNLEQSQIIRLYQISLWSSGPGAVVQETDTLKLSSGVIEKAKSLNARFIRDYNDLYDPRNITTTADGAIHSATQQSLDSKANTLFDQYDGQVQGLLSPDQRTQWKTLRGKKFILWKEVK